jgi:predicted unusual protein kinase regulating ubiquinone biosynthesis (AarF/ABC1/UbiB family)
MFCYYLLLCFLCIIEEADNNKVSMPMQRTDAAGGVSNQLQLGLLSPPYVRRLFERMGATYIKLGQVSIKISILKILLQHQLFYGWELP